MKYNVKATGVSLTPALDQYIERRIKAIAKFVDKSDESAIADVEVGKISDHHRSGEIFRAEINIALAHQPLLRAEVTEYDIYNAVNAAKNEIIRQIKSSKNKENTKTRKGNRKVKEMIRGWYPKRKQ